MKGVELVKAQPAYQVADRYVKFDEKAELLKTQGIEIAHFMNDKVFYFLRERMVFYYDEATKVISFLFEVFQEHQEQVQKYVNTNYENVKVELQKNWMRLDFDKDGIVSVEDFKTALFQLYEFLLNFNYLEHAQAIKNDIYERAAALMKSQNEQ
jgi:hypothetical protein